MVRGSLFFLLWFLSGGALSAWTIDLFMMASMGGVFEPPAIWSIARDLGLIILPPLLLLGGAPPAIQIIRGAQWRKAAIVMLVVCATTWLTLMVVVWWGPAIWYWSW